MHLNSSNILKYLEALLHGTHCAHVRLRESCQVSLMNFKLKEDKSKAWLFLLLCIKEALKKAQQSSPFCLEVPATIV